LLPRRIVKACIGALTLLVITVPGTLIARRRLKRSCEHFEPLPFLLCLPRLVASVALFRVCFPIRVLVVFAHETAVVLVCEGRIFKGFDSFLAELGQKLRDGHAFGRSLHPGAFLARNHSRGEDVANSGLLKLVTLLCQSLGGSH
jgi:hypothetical protein